MSNKVFEDVIARIPDYKVFLTVEELNASSKALSEEYPDIVELFTFGWARSGDEILGLKIGEGTHNALVFGLPHPNEPIGTMMLEYFTKELATNKALRKELDYTWYIVKTWDSDGAKLNEGWFKGPFTLYNYSRNFFRPAGHCQVDWTFPVDYKKLKFDSPIPETQAMMKLIDRIKPRFIYSLHNAGFGGVYWYLTENIKEVYPDIKNAATRVSIPLNLGEPEAPYCKPFAPAIYNNLGIQEEYDYLEQYGVKDISSVIQVGTCSADYAKSRYNSFTMLTELPYFYNKNITDLSNSGYNRGEIVRKSMMDLRENEKKIYASLRRTDTYMSKDNPFLVALNAFESKEDNYQAKLKMTYEDPEYAEENATVAEKFDNEWVAKFYQMLSIGLVIRANEFEMEKLDRNKEADLYKIFEAEYQEGIELLKKKSDELEDNMHYEVVPIRKLVSIQLECGLIVAKYLQEKE